MQRTIEAESGTTLTLESSIGVAWRVYRDGQQIGTVTRMPPECKVKWSVTACAPYRQPGNHLDRAWDAGTVKSGALLALALVEKEERDA